MQWRIDQDGIHIDAKCLDDLDEAVKRVRHRLTCEPRTVAEKNAESARTMMLMMTPPEQRGFVT
jgi:hypothetical protein